MGDSRDALSGAKPNKGSPVSVLRSLLHKPVSEVVDESGLREAREVLGGRCQTESAETRIHGPNQLQFSSHARASAIASS